MPLPSTSRTAWSSARPSCADGKPAWLRPDAKSQVTSRYANGKPETIDTMVISTQHGPSRTKKCASRDREVIKPVLRRHVKGNIKYHVNPDRPFVIGGPQGDSGVTGRKIIVDTYGGCGAARRRRVLRQGSVEGRPLGSLRGRYIAKNIVAAGLARKCLVQVSYAIGVAQPRSVMVTTTAPARLSDDALSALVREHFDLARKASSRCWICCVRSI